MVTRRQADIGQGYFAISQAVAFVPMLPQDAFESIMNPANGTSAVIMAHLIALEALIAPMIMYGSDAHTGRVNGRACGTCMQRLHESCPLDFRKYLTWPLQFCTAQELRFKHGLKKEV